MLTYKISPKTSSQKDDFKSILKKKGYNTNVGDEGGFAPNLKSNNEACEFMVEAIEAGGYIPGKDIPIALGPATGESSGATVAIRISEQMEQVKRGE